MAIRIAIVDMRRKAGRTVVIFPDCHPALIKVRDMKREGASSGLLHCVSAILNE